MILNTFEIMKPDAPFSDEIMNSDKAREKRTKKPANFDGSSIESPKRPRGRPPGSKNKPKPSLFLSPPSDPSPPMHPQVLEIPGGLDILDCLARFSKQRRLGICVLAATGLVANVTLRQPVAAAIVFRGRFEILSISATFLPPEMAAVSTAAAISLAGMQGQIVGGMVVGPLMAAGMVVVVAAVFANPRFYRLPAEEELSDEVSGSGGEEGGERRCDGEEQKYYYHHLHRRQGLSTAPVAELCGMGFYGSHFSPEIVLPGGARAPPPPPPPY